MGTSMNYRNSLKLTLTFSTIISLLVRVVPCTGNEPVVKKVGDKAELGHCNNDKAITNSIVMWEVHRPGKKIQTVTEKHSFDSRVQIHRNHYEELLLEINTVREADAGRYICKTGTTGNMSIHKEIEIIVQFGPKLSWESINRTMHEGETGELWCNASGIPKPTIEWFRKFRVNNDTRYENIGISGNMLRIHNITRYAKDIYKCHASNELGSAEGFINVDVLFPAELEVFEEELQGVNGDLNVEMACAVTANPMVNIVWYKGDEENHIQENNWKYKIQNEDDMKEYYYTTISILKKVYPLEHADFDTYYCKAQNDTGHDIASKAINLARRPEK
ncbi:hypothetical protein ACJMK2_038896 [Sinanodonta woodiana]|uniref:Ig-like domain-containing protein n=1 Tax=Sinanodonta woodiana TaxID=1069815 RepID=A0ABD3WDJ6_SINWO